MSWKMWLSVLIVLILCGVIVVGCTGGVKSDPWNDLGVSKDEYMDVFNYYYHVF